TGRFRDIDRHSDSHRRESTQAQRNAPVAVHLMQRHRAARACAFVAQWFTDSIQARIIMRARSWVIVAVVGFVVMLLAYSTRPQVDPKAPWASGLIVIGPELPPEWNKMARTTSVRARLVPGGELTERVLKAISQADQAKSASLEKQLRPKLIELPL